VIQVGDQPLLGLSVSRDGRLELSVELLDRDDNLLGRIAKNEWITGDSFPWDLQYGERWLRLRCEQQGVALYIDARQQPILVQGTLWFNKQRFDLTEDAVMLNGGADSPQGGATLRNLAIVGGNLLAMPETPGLFVVAPTDFSRP